jgi:putative salt-induced outer membrane protein YdiY
VHSLLPTVFIIVILANSAAAQLSFPLPPALGAASDPMSLAPTTEALSEQLPMPVDSLQTPPPDLTFVAPEGPSWYYPWTWFPRDGWSNSAELGINGSSGNANSFSFQAGTRFKRKTEINLFDLRLTHNRTQSNGVEKQNNALMYADFDRYFGQSPWSAFVKNGVEYDRFKAFNVRYNINVGLGYRFIKTENLNLKGRFGSGTSREFGGPDDRWVPEALFGGDYEHQWNKRNKWIARVDYFPEWGNFTNYRLVSDVSWEMLWDEAGNLSFKLGAIDRYDSTPNGLRPNDLTYSMLLLYKF